MKDQQTIDTALAFFKAHAIPPLAAPSCFMCGDTVPQNPAVTHGELPEIVGCARCHAACQAAKRLTLAEGTAR